MKYLSTIPLFALLALNSSAQSAETLAVRYQINKPYCVLNFMETLRTNGFYGPSLYEFYSTSKFKDDKNLQELVKRYKRLDYRYKYEFDGYPKYRFMSKDRTTRDLFYVFSARADTLDEFKQISAGIIPNYQHQELFEIFRAAELVYDELIWKQYHRVAKERLSEVVAYSEQIKLDTKLSAIVTFTGSSWPMDMPLVVSFSIVPGNRLRLIPPPQSNIIFCGLLTESVDNSSYIGKIVHEFAHRAFAEQALGRHQQIDQWLTDSDCPHRFMVNLMFNEVLGGAVGHKIREEYIGPHEFTYGQSFIKDFDEAIYPLVASYMDAGKSIDKTFVEQSLDIYEKTFPNAHNEYQYLLQTYYLLTDAQDYPADELCNLIIRNIASPMMYETGTPIIDDNKMNAALAYDFTKLFVITKDHRKTINYLTGKIDKLNTFANLNPESDFVLSFHDADGKAYIIMNLHSTGKFEEALKTLKVKKTIDPDNPMVLLD